MVEAFPGINGVSMFLLVEAFPGIKGVSMFLLVKAFSGVNGVFGRLSPGGTWIPHTQHKTCSKHG